VPSGSRKKRDEQFGRCKQDRKMPRKEESLNRTGGCTPRIKEKRAIRNAQGGKDWCKKEALLQNVGRPAEGGASNRGASTRRTLLCRIKRVVYQLSIGGLVVAGENLALINIT